ncbi:MAG: TetR/AcrR family transcriptional regulator [Phyllobacteriaceae bacterium]|nr:TetR/AcrR family transcriptional regulator [Phyllobacteriaceae bacterium]
MTEASRKRRIHDRDREADIIDAAHRLFSEKGFDGTSVAEIARAAEVAEGTLYLYAATKRDLLAKVIERWYAGLIDALKHTLDAEPDAKAKLHAFVRAQFAVFVDHAAFGRLLARDIRAEPGYRESALYRMNRDYTRLFMDLLRQGQAEGVIRDDLLLDIARDLFFGGIEHAAIAGVSRETLNPRARAFFETWWAGVRA